jgi:exosortase/archaeosortase family protein
MHGTSASTPPGSLIGVIAGTVLFVWGTRHSRILAFPIAFLLLMVPLPVILFNQIAFPLQLVASHLGETVIAAAGVPVLREGNVLQLPTRTLVVAEACSGIRSLVSLTMLGIELGYFTERRTPERIALAVAALPIAIVANAARVAGTGLASEWMDEWLAASPADSRLRMLSARTNLVAGRAADAERELRELVSRDPSQLEATDLLGRIYASRGQLDRALSEYEALGGRSKRPAGVQTMIGMIHEARGDRVSARAAYEKALEADSQAGVAANNLAWMLAQDGHLDEALRLATRSSGPSRWRRTTRPITITWASRTCGLATTSRGAARCNGRWR